RARAPDVRHPWSGIMPQVGNFGVIVEARLEKLMPRWKRNRRSGCGGDCRLTADSGEWCRFCRYRSRVECGVLQRGSTCDLKTPACSTRYSFARTRDGGTKSFQ